MAKKEIGYEQRYCAFLDILGFSDLIADIGRGRVEYGVVRELLRKIHQPSKYDKVGTADFRATEFHLERLQGSKYTDPNVTSRTTPSM
jgi:hypothetical protein